MATVKDFEPKNVAKILRLSITGECNLNCFYCKPMGRFKDLNKPKNILLPSDVSKLVKIVGEMGVRRVWISGGEPLLRKDAPSFIKSAHAYKAVEEVRLVTNGTFLKAHADGLRKYGLRKVDINFDSLSFQKYQRITGSDSLYRVLDGIEKVERLNFIEIRLNILLLSGINQDEIVNFSRITKERKLHIRFLEYTPAVHAQDPYMDRKKLSIVEAKNMIDNYQMLERRSDLDATNPKSIPSFQFKDGVGKISFLSPMEVEAERAVPSVLFTPDGMLHNEHVPGRSMSLIEDLRRDAKDPKLHKAIEKIIQMPEEAKKVTVLKQPAKSDVKDFPLKAMKASRPVKTARA